MRIPLLNLGVTILIGIAAACGGTSSSGPGTGAPNPDGGVEVPQADAAAPDAGPPIPVCMPGEMQACTCASGVASMGVCGEGNKVLQCDCEPGKSSAPITLSTGQFNAETHIAAAPGGELAAAWIGASQGSIVYAFSHNNGLTWKSATAPRDSANREASDPVLAVDAKGNFYLTYIAFKRTGAGSASDMKVRVHRARVGADRFDAPVDADSGPMGGDKPWITTTKTGAVVVTYMVQTGDSSTEERMARSTDQGATFTVAKVSGGAGNFIVPCASKTGDRLWAAFIDFASVTVQLAWSDDDGVSWPPANKRQVSPNQVAVPPSCAAQGEEVWIAYPYVRNLMTQDQPADEYRVARFDGKTLTEAPAYSKSLSHLGELIMEDLPGVMSLTLYTGTREGDRAGLLQRVRSKDGGKTWTPAAISAPLTFTTARDNQLWLGDYVGTATVGGTFYATYGNNASGTTAVAFTKVEAN
jgi:hypothetical protein